MVAYNLEPRDDREYWVLENIRDDLVEEVRSSLTQIISNNEYVDSLIDCFHYAWQNEDNSAEKLARKLGFGQEHLFALDGNTKAMIDEIHNNRSF